MQIILILFTVFFTNNIVAQTIKESEYVGTIELPDNSIITYKIKFIEKEGGYIEGTSVTDFQGKDKTISKIRGNINSKRDHISFYETENISTRSSADENTFCYIHLNNAKIKKVGNKTIIQGSFKGQLKSGDNCVNGYIYLISSDFLDLVIQKGAASDRFKNNDTVKQLLNTYNNVVKKDYITELKNSETLTINIKESDAIVEVWDGYAEDGDEITIYVNDVIVLERFGITQQKKTIVVPLHQKKTILKFTAVSEGLKPPCTVNVMIRSEKENHQIRTVLKQNEAAFVKIIKG